MEHMKGNLSAANTRYFKYHSGSVALGSFLLFITILIRFWMQSLQVYNNNFFEYREQQDQEIATPEPDIYSNVVYAVLLVLRLSL